MENRQTGCRRLLADTPPPAEQGALMQKHLAHIRSQAESEKFVLARAVLDKGRVHGVAVVQAATAKDAAKYAEKHPMTLGGWMKAGIYPVMLEDPSGVRFEYPAKKAD